MKNMLSVMPYTSFGRLVVYMDEQIAEHMKGEPQPEVDKPKN